MKSDLWNHPDRFAFFQAVRLLENAARAAGQARAAVGYDADPSEEIVRFRGMPTFSHPAGEVSGVDSRADGMVEMTVSFFGLTGPSGVLPAHYTTLLLSRLRKHDSTLSDFLDLFLHRLVSLFYRASEKYRIERSFERSVREGTPDGFACVLKSLVGLTTPQQNYQQEVESVSVGFAGFFSRQQRPAAALAAILSTYFAVPAKIEQFCSQWLRLDSSQQTRLVSESAGCFSQLGTDTVIGERVREFQAKFAVRIGPVDGTVFHSFLPGSDRFFSLKNVVTQFVGAEFDCEVQFEVAKDSVPIASLGGNSDDGSRLGWNTWLASRPFANDVTDAAFMLENHATA